MAAIGGNAGDRPAIAWAAEEAERGGCPLLIVHAAGHLNPQLSYAGRHVARQQARARSLRLLENAVHLVQRLAPDVPVTSVVRLRECEALLPALCEIASTIALASDAWRLERDRRREPVVAVLGDAATDGYVASFASQYARRRGVDLSILEGTGADFSRRVLEHSRSSSLLLLPRPPRAYGSIGFTSPMTLELLRHSGSPLVLLSPSSSGAAYHDSHGGTAARPPGGGAAATA